MIEIPLALFQKARGDIQGQLRSKKGPLDESCNEKFEHRPADETSFFITGLALSDHFLRLRIPAECTGNDGP